MVRPFQLARFPVIHFGPGKAELLPELTGRYGKNVIIVTGQRSFVSSVHYGRLTDAFVRKGINFSIVSVAGEPSPGLVDETVKRFEGAEVDVVVSVGGGSAIDAGKAISAMMHKDVSVTDYLEGVGHLEHPGTKVPFIAVPTTSGTGSETTKNAVISKTGRDGFKRSLRHDNLVPDIAVVDPVLTVDCPEDITAASGMDCFTQLTEAWLSDRSSVLTDMMAEEGFRAIKRSLLRSYTNGDDIEARSDMSFAAMISGICLANAGLGAVHGLAGTIGGLFNIPHGVICGSLMSSANEVNVRELRKISGSHPALAKYAHLGKMFLDKEDETDDYYIDGFIDRLYQMTEMMNLPGLMCYGVSRDDVRAICSATDLKNNPVKLSVDDLEEIMVRRL